MQPPIQLRLMYRTVSATLLREYSPYRPPSSDDVRQRDDLYLVREDP